MISATIEMLVIDTATNQPKTGDAANLSCFLSLDGAAFSPLTTPAATEVDPVRAKGLYRFALSAPERTGNKWLFTGTSITSDVAVIPREVRTAELDSATRSQIGATLMLSTTIATVTSQTVLVLTAGSGDNDAYKDALIVITDAVTAVQKASVVATDYDGASKTLTLGATPVFVVSAGDSVSVIAVAVVNPAITLTLGATLPLTPGEVSGLSDEKLVIGDDYTSEVGRRIPITLTDINGDAISVTYGAHSLGTNCSIKALFQPLGQQTTKAAITGTCEFVAASGATPAYLLLTLPRAETAKASPGKYQTHIEARWTDGFNVTLAYSGVADFTRDIQRVS